MKMYKKELTKEEKAKLEKLRNNMQRYQELLTWQKLRRAEKRCLSCACGMTTGAPEERC
jgi:hypothetical protein